MNNSKYLYILIAFILFGLYQHRTQLNLDIQGHHNWRQSQTMWNVRNFVRHDANILNPRISNFNGDNDNLLRYEFPIMQWSIALLMKLFGEHIIIARLMLFLIGSFAILGIFFIIHRITDEWRSALIGGVLFQYSPLFYFYTINPLPDILAMTASIWYIHFFLKFIDTKNTRSLIYASAFILLATLAKLPFIIFSILSIFYFFSSLLRARRIDRDIIKVSSIQIAWILPAILWYAWVMPQWSGNSVVKGIFTGEFDVDRYKEIFDFHRTVMFPEIILSKYTWLLFIVGLFGLPTLKKYRKWLFSVIAITIVYLVFEFIPIGVMHDYYMLPFLIWMYIVIGVGAHTILKFSKYFMYPLLVLCVASGLYTADISQDKWSIESSGVEKELYTHTAELVNAVPSDEMCIILNDVSGYVFSYKIDKMGYQFSNDYLPTPWVVDMINNYDIHYMYSNSKVVNSDPEIQKLITDTLVSTKTIKVYRLVDHVESD